MRRTELSHQDGSRHEWADARKWDRIVTMDDATNEHYGSRFVEEEGTASSMSGIREVSPARSALHVHLSLLRKGNLKQRRNRAARKSHYRERLIGLLPRSQPITKSSNRMTV
ncbi:MAG: hypothetical protein LBI59_05345 [Candidatus Accumulibacter sp.]|jgi:hypothetical protein|nr:hypothetical protein [Accumulibacter sp.]